MKARQAGPVTPPPPHTPHRGRAMAFFPFLNQTVSELQTLRKETDINQPAKF